MNMPSMKVEVNDGFNAPPGGEVKMEINTSGGYNAPPGGTVSM